MFELRFKANDNIFTYTSYSFVDEMQVRNYFWTTYVPKYFSQDLIQILYIKRLV